MSVFREVPESSWVASNAHAFAFRDRSPVSPGHTLVVARREVEDWFAATDDERAAVMQLVDHVKRQLDDEHHPDGYNVGFNAGLAAGQTVMHLHVHVIPRYRGDVPDPRGGVRHVLPARANYLRAPALATGGDADPFSRHVLPLFQRATDIAIVAAFVQESGLDRIETAVRSALAGGARVRIITGDYLDITQPGALERLLDWQHLGLGSPERDDEENDGGPAEEIALAESRCQVRIVETARVKRSFHPKSWLVEGPGSGVAFVGSSNLSRMALEAGIEWNLRVDREVDPLAFGRVRDAFEAQWREARALDAAWVEAYARRPRRSPPGNAVTDDDREPLPQPATPHDVQREALGELRAARARGRRRALVVLATGLGKTWLAAFDLAQLREELGRTPRLLFLAHRRELLTQAAAVYRRLLRALGDRARVGRFFDDEDGLDADLVFASVAKLSRPHHLGRLDGMQFDYVVVDEVHHAAAETYRRILGHLKPDFLLGLTATPDRADAADIGSMFDDFVAYRADIPRGVAIGLLTPFRYFGIRDDIDYTNVPWRRRDFAPEVVAALAQTEARMLRLWRAWADHAGSRTLVFCCTVAHAEYVRAWLHARGVRVAAVHASEGSADREQALADLASGRLDAVCSVDMFNEGIDVPSIDRIVMLRPTASRVVFLQQLGRGLRASPGKDAVTVIDFVGNHRAFLERLRTLLALGGESGSGTLRTLLTGDEATELPAGCAVELELEAKDLLASLLVDPVLKVHAADGTPLDASFSIELRGEVATIVYEARGGTAGTAGARNVQYGEGLTVLLERLAAAGITIDDVLVESRDVASTPAAQRRVVIEQRPYPITIDDALALRKQLSKAQAQVGRATGARGAGNSTRRLRIVLRSPAPMPIVELARRLQFG